ncbi:hypothetical protein [Streptomyces luteireticuli]|uniref:hypothetical protein n=1 Tax=Streptomyces luteireticuli TaxID=173858 RepID=UPI00355842E5
MYADTGHRLTHCPAHQVDRVVAAHRVLRPGEGTAELGNGRPLWVPTPQPRTPAQR